jgi:hypothetical protein
MYNVLFPSGKVKSYYVRDVAEMYSRLGNGVLLPLMPLDKGPAPDYNGFVVNDVNTMETL